jgi:hypothetical protein
MKSIYLIFILLLVNCKDPKEKSLGQLNTNKYSDSIEIPISNKWYGKYSFVINENSDDWRDIHDISITINKDSITYLAKGFQLYQLYKLSAIEKNNTLKLAFEKSLDNTDSWALKKTKDFGTITFDNKNYNWECPYIDISYNENKKVSYILKKSQ